MPILLHLGGFYRRLRSVDPNRLRPGCILGKRHAGHFAPGCESAACFRASQRHHPLMQFFGEFFGRTRRFLPDPRSLILIEIVFPQK